MKENLYLKILEFGANSIGNPITKEDLFEFLNVDISRKNSISLIVHNIFDKAFEQADYSPAKYNISLNAYFQYLEHIRLEEARKDSKKAIGISVSAIIISIILTLIQIFKC
jgi:hypothetical protein